MHAFIAEIGEDYFVSIAVRRAYDSGTVIAHKRKLLTLNTTGDITSILEPPSACLLKIWYDRCETDDNEPKSAARPQAIYYVHTSVPCKRNLLRQDDRPCRLGPYL